MSAFNKPSEEHVDRIGKFLAEYEAMMDKFLRELDSMAFTSVPADFNSLQTAKPRERTVQLTDFFDIPDMPELIPPSLERKK